MPTAYVNLFLHYEPKALVIFEGHLIALHVIARSCQLVSTGLDCERPFGASGSTYFVRIPDELYIARYRPRSC